LPDPAFWPDDPQRGVDLILINVQKNAMVDVTYVPAGDLSLDQWQDRVLGWFGSTPGMGPARQDRLLGFSQCKLRQSRRLPAQRGVETAELLLDVRHAGESRTYLVRLVKRERELYVLRGWTPRRRFAPAESEIRKALDSFRLVDN
jgi:hypothetical protein